MEFIREKSKNKYAKKKTTESERQDFAEWIQVQNEEDEREKQKQSTGIDYLIGEEATLRHYPKAFEYTQEEVDEVMEICKERDRLKFTCYGKPATMWRRQVMFGCEYKFSGKVVTQHEGEQPILVTKALDFAEQEFPGVGFNAVLAVFYEAGDYISPHRDGEKGLAKGQPILGFSFGDSRAVKIKSHKRKRGEDGFNQMEMVMEDGSCYIMHGPRFQQDFTHGVGKGTGERLSLTVRMFN